MGFNSRKLFRKSIIIAVAANSCIMLLVWLALKYFQPSLIHVFPRAGLSMVSVPAGTFIMGGPQGDSRVGRDEKPEHEVFVSAFLIDRCEVTVGAFRQFVKESGYKPLGEWDDASFEQKEDHPVVNVSWWDAIHYCNWRSRVEGLQPCYNENTGECDFSRDGYRLPTEAEWEKAARGTRRRTYPWGDAEPDADGIIRANYSRKKDGFYYTVEVWRFQEYKSPYGAIGMAGNVQEWCNDRYDAGYYQSTSYKDPVGPLKGESRVLRGGFWFSDAGQLRASERTADAPGYINEYTGFRCARNK
jgi:formylglycine-generating enzyme required for sulfatase activity